MFGYGAAEVGLTCTYQLPANVDRSYPVECEITDGTHVMIWHPHYDDKTRPYALLYSAEFRTETDVKNFLQKYYPKDLWPPDVFKVMNSDAMADAQRSWISDTDVQAVLRNYFEIHHDRMVQLHSALVHTVWSLQCTSKTPDGIPNAAKCEIHAPLFEKIPESTSYRVQPVRLFIKDVYDRVMHRLAFTTRDHVLRFLIKHYPRTAWDPEGADPGRQEALRVSSAEISPALSDAIQRVAEQCQQIPAAVVNSAIKEILDTLRVRVDVALLLKTPNPPVAQRDDALKATASRLASLL